MRIHVKGHHLSTTQIWFESFDKIADIPKDDFVVVRMNKVKEPLGDKSKYSSEEFTSLVTDLTLPEAEWGIHKKHLKKIRRSEREQTKIIFYDSEDILRDSNVLNEMNAIFIKMFSSKGMKNSLPTNELLAYANNGNLLIGKAVTSSGDAVWRSYIMDENNARCLQSCSLHYDVDKERSNALSRANCHLVFETMKKLAGGGGIAIRLGRNIRDR